MNPTDGREATMGDVMSATEAGDLLGAMTPGTLEVAEIRDGRLIDAGPQEFAVVIHDDPRAHQKPDGTWHSVIVCRGMDGPSRGSNAAALSSVKQALSSVVALHAERADLARQVAEMRDRLDKLESDAEMACESPADDCDCAGCLTARERNGGAS